MNKEELESGSSITGTHPDHQALTLHSCIGLISTELCNAWPTHFTHVILHTTCICFLNSCHFSLWSLIEMFKDQLWRSTNPHLVIWIQRASQRSLKNDKDSCHIIICMSLTFTHTPHTGTKGFNHQSAFQSIQSSSRNPLQQTFLFLSLRTSFFLLQLFNLLLPSAICWTASKTFNLYDGLSFSQPQTWQPLGAGKPFSTPNIWSPQPTAWPWPIFVD